MKPLSVSRCVVVLCIVLFAVATRAPAAATAAPTEPASAADPGPGWMSRLAAAPGKLAFWKKDSAPEAAAVAAPSPPTKTPKALAAGKTPAVAAPKTEKPLPEATAPPSKKVTAGSKPPAEPAVAVEEPKKPGFLGRLWPGGEKPAPIDSDAAAHGKPAVADATTRTKEKLGPTKPEALKKADETKAKPVPGTVAATTPAAALQPKPSLWSRVASALVPAKAATPAVPATPPDRRGHQVAALEPNGSTFVITKDESPFFTFGPHQATAPDAYLSTGTVVTVQEKSWGWAQVQLPDGRTGTIARDALRAATAADLLPASLPPSLMAAANSRRSSSAENYVMPPAAMPDLPTGATGPTSAAEAEELSSALLPPFAE